MKNAKLFTIVMALATFVVIIDNTIMNVSISALVKDLNTTVSGVQAAISLNALTMAAFVLMGGKLADILGIKKTFLRGSIIYMVGSLLASFANNLTIFILGWCAIQGFGAALMLPNVQTAIRTYLSGEERAKSYGIMGGVNALAIAVGPILGGFLTTFYSWRWAFRLEVITLAGMLFLSYVIPKDKKIENRIKLDVGGVILQALAMILMVLGILLVSEYGLFFARNGQGLFGLSPSVYLFAVGVIFMMLFINHEHKREDAKKSTLLDLKLFANRIFSRALNIASIQTMLIAGLLFTIPLFLQVTFGLNALQSGLYLLPLSLSLLVFALVGVRIKKKLNPRIILLLGWATVIASAIIFLIRMEFGAGPNDLILGLIVFGSGVGLLASQTNNFVMSSVEKQKSAEASGILNTFQQVGNSVGVAILGTILSVALVYSINTQVTQSTVITSENKQAVSQKLTSGVEVASTEYVEQQAQNVTTDEQASEIATIYEIARTNAFQATTVTMGLFALLAFVMTLGLPKKIKETEETF